MAKHTVSPSVSLFLPFPDEAAESRAEVREFGGLYMHCEIDEGAFQIVRPWLPHLS